MHFEKTRLAPTPSGFLHIGNVCSFLLTAALAKRAAAKLLLRIDDMDRDRVDPHYIADIFETLEFLGIGWQEGPRNAEELEAQYSQRHRLLLYETALGQLKETGLVYACNCSRTEILRRDPNGYYSGTCRHSKIPLDAEGACWRIDTSHANEIVVKTFHGLLSCRLPDELRDFIVRKKDGFPAYQLCSLMDDLHFGVDLIVRGMDLWPSTLAQLYLGSLLPENSFAKATFYHHPLLADGQARKLSKSAGDTSISYLRRHGNTAGDIFGQIGRELSLKRSATDLETFSESLILSGYF